jgi:thiol-disulfide isomerase/thioredoxin
MGAAAALVVALTFAALQGDVTVVAFFATSCAPCKTELPMVEALHQSLAGDARVHVIAVSVDERDARKLRPWTRALGLTMPVIVEPKLYAALFGDDVVIPRLVVIDRQRHGLQRTGLVAGQPRAEFVREVTAAIESVKAGAPTPPATTWRRLPAAP